MTHLDTQVRSALEPHMAEITIQGILDFVVGRLGIPLEDCSPDELIDALRLFNVGARVFVRDLEGRSLAIDALKHVIRQWAEARSDAHSDAVRDLT